MKHCDQVLNLLRTQVGNESEVNDIKKTAEEVVEKWINPLTGGSASTNGLIYGLVQSGKTGVLTVTGAMGADEGYKTIIILTSDIDPLYEQTLGRAQEAFPGIDILGKNDIRDSRAFVQRIKGGTCAIVVTKNSALLNTLIENFRGAKLRGLTCLIIDDEADQASLNTKASRVDGSRSSINQLIEALREFFFRNTYLQVTATPQALFLQEGEHAFRPKFTVLSHPGSDYVGGEDFFADNSTLVTEFPIAEIDALAAGSQPSPSGKIPSSLVQALDTFMIGATYKRTKNADQNCAFLCHVSTKTADHKHIVELLRKYKTDLAQGLKSRNSRIVARLERAYDDLAATHKGIRDSDFDTILASIAFLSPGITVKLVNGETDEDVALRSPFNLFVGGNKLGRGVTIKNLLVSYYGRNPRTPQADTVLQHARMYGYRRKDIGMLRLFLPRELHVLFRAINKMEQGLRELISTSPTEGFRGIYVETGLKPTRKSVLVPGAIGAYLGGHSYNPAQILRDSTTVGATKKLDDQFIAVKNKTYVELPIKDILAILHLIKPDEKEAEQIWNVGAMIASIEQYANIHNQTTGQVYIDRERGLKERRHETQGILTGGELANVPAGLVTLFLLRTTAHTKSNSAWWPQLRFPKGQYAFAFAI